MLTEVDHMYYVIPRANTKKSVQRDIFKNSIK